MAKLEEETRCQVTVMDAKLLMLKIEDDSANLWWRERLLLQFLWGLQISYKWLQGDKHFCKMGSRNAKQTQHNRCG